MKALLVVVSTLVLVIAALWVGVRPGDPAPGPPAPVTAADARTGWVQDAERIETLERRVEDLASEVDLLREELARIGWDRRSAESIERGEGSEPAARAAVRGGLEGPSAAWYLEQYERSFDEGGGGSEYFRLAVAAYARELLLPIEVRIRSTAKPLAFRRELVRILGDRRFVRDGRVSDVLLWLLGIPGEETLIAEALKALAIVGDASTARALESLVWRIEDLRLRQEAIDLLVALSGDDANAALYRLMRSAPDDATMAHLVSQLSNAELVASLEAFHLASQSTKRVRLAAAARVGEFRSAEFQAFVDTWAAIESDPDVLELLGRARDEQHKVPSWSAAQATGAPDAGANRDDPRAWATRAAEMGEQWLELTYSPPLRASSVCIFEVNSPGAITALIAFDEQGGEHALWSGTDPTQTAGPFEIEFPSTAYRVARIRVVLDTDRRQGWNEIDAVELIGPDGRAWASGAVASSEYGG